MKKIILLLCVASLFACSNNPFEETNTLYSNEYKNSSSNTTQVRVHRVSQLSGAALGDDCPLVLKVDDKEIAGLQKNQFVDLYLPNGHHNLSVRFKCALTSWRKTLEIDVTGNYQEYKTEIGVAGQYRMWRVK
ncbi:hypothetical protein [Klebsiella aerogenes]|uniref:hypothetical protein n=1 Tax=Klebsiella aerogenes TaxID=548 RepID=UPI002A826EE0|nr:hypothetical protein [Klebsiella aerogenes]WPR97263.1 hypothetical protein SM790_16410 [Klebsiella aerogenes]WPS36546.1 hypothetical protein SM910_16665 [Klebsiella aerogenes]